MPIANGAKGRPGIIGAPGLGRSDRFLRTGGGGPPLSVTLSPGDYSFAPWRSRPLDSIGRFITGVTRDSTGTPIANCTVDLYYTSTDQRVDTVVSDGSGNFTFGASGGPYYIVAYKAGAPDVFGTTVNTLTGA
jgi:hypothetical protein